MRSTLSLTPSLQSIFWKKTDTFSKELFFIFFGTLLLTLSAHFSLPFQPVPLTFQSAMVIVIGMISGVRLGTYTVGAYLIAGLSGLPVFANTASGVPFLFSPTIGYAFGFLPAVALSGYLAQKGFARTILKSFVAACLGASIIFLCGVSVLAQSVGWDKAVTFGLLPFILTEPMKLFVASFIIPKCWKMS